MQKPINSIFTVDCVIFGFDEEELKILLIDRGEEPFEGRFALPGYFVHDNEDVDQAANRVLEELTGLSNIFLEQFSSFGKIDRHPWGRILTVAYYALVKLDDYRIEPGSIAQSAEWFSVTDLPEPAFDHQEIIKKAFEVLKAKVRYHPVGFELLPKKFTLRRLQNLYEAILETGLDKRNFRRKILKMGIIKPLDEKQTGVAHKAARYYCFDPEKYEELTRAGFLFSIVGG